ncbi:MAG: hypothetical protein ACRYF2_04035 [Janthinobacterium lividum]
MSLLDLDASWEIGPSAGFGPSVLFSDNHKSPRCIPSKSNAATTADMKVAANVPRASLLVIDASQRRVEPTDKPFRIPDWDELPVPGEPRSLAVAIGAEGWTALQLSNGSWVTF